jgi:phosphoglycerate kinase
VNLLLPVDVVVANSLDAPVGTVVDASAIPDGTMALDIGPKTIALYGEQIERAKTIFWNGPMGLFESVPFSRGTFDIAKIMSTASGFTVIGGGDSAAAVRKAGGEIAAGIDHISTGGGAALELIEGRKLPGIEALRMPEDAS